MSLRRVQVCEQCGATRDLKSSESPDNGGWRALSSGSLEATFCNHCVRVMVMRALAAAEARAKAVVQ